MRKRVIHYNQKNGCRLWFSNINNLWYDQVGVKLYDAGKYASNIEVDIIPLAEYNVDVNKHVVKSKLDDLSKKFLE